MKLVTLLLTVALTCSAFAGNDKKNCPKPQPKPPVHNPDPKPANPTSTSVSNSAANASSASSSSASSSSSANQSQGQNQTQGQTASTGDQANSQSSNYSSNYQEVRQTPFAFAPSIFTGDCQKALTGGASSPLAALSLGGSRTDKDCQALRLAGAFLSLNNFNAAAKVLCSTDSAKRAKLTIDDCMGFVQISQTEVPAPQVIERIVEVPAAPQPPVQITVNVPPSLPPTTVLPPPAPTVKKKVVRKVNKPAKQPECVVAEIKKECK